ncbi:MAG: sigma-54 interaction domain-containing protein [Smithellaceae bacterium]
MNFKESELFSQMTLRICGSLDLETGLQRSFDYLKNFIPLDMMAIHLYDPKLGRVRVLSETSNLGTKSMDSVILLDEKAKTTFRNAPDIRIVENPEYRHVLKKIIKFPKTFSAMVMRLTIEKRKIGCLLLTAEGTDRYTEEHRQIFSLLNEPFAIALSNSLAYQEVVRLKDMMVDDNRYLRQELQSMSGEEIIGSAFGLKNVMEMVHKVAPLESPVLLLGETGVGKGVLANAIHNLSPRSKGPFITVNSGAIPETLIDSELFGHEKGAFTGAIEQKRGRFERANGGTIFLDEIAELPLNAQVRMLRVLQEKVIERVGGSKSLPVDIRIIVATHRNLDEMVSSGQFREDLLFRINVFPIIIPPLRDRKDDIPLLFSYFINKKVRQLKIPVLPELAPGVMKRFMEYDWPGNIRELENVIEREMILNRKGPLTFSSFPLKKSTPHHLVSTSSLHMERLSLKEISIQHITRTLESTGGKIYGPDGAAVLLGINPNTLRSRMKKLKIINTKKRVNVESASDRIYLIK